MKTKPFLLTSCLVACLIITACNQIDPRKQFVVNDATSGLHISQDNSGLFKVVNSANQAFANVPLVLSKAQVMQLGLDTDTNALQQFEIHLASDKHIQPNQQTKLLSQTDDLDGDGKWDELAFLVDISPRSELTLLLQITNNPAGASINTTHASLTGTNIRFAQYTNKDKSQARELMTLSRRGAEIEDGYSRKFQMEGPAWENDNIAFRLYFDERNGFDIFGKTNTSQVLDSVGIGANYHELQDWGMDILKVGRSLGAGALAFADPAQLNNAPLQRLENATQTRVQIISEGPVRSIFNVNYRQLPINYPQQAIVNLNQQISIWTGQHYYSSEIILSATQSSTALAVGIVNFHEASPNESVVGGHAILASYGVQAEQNTNLGMAVVGKQSDHIGYGRVDASKQGIEYSFFNTFKLEVEQPLRYDFYAVWQPRMQEINDGKAFLNLIKQDISRKQSVNIQLND